jgi:arginyl-tRNA synthetase
MDLAGVFHAFYPVCRVISPDPAEATLSCARLRLVAATKAVFARVLDLMGVNAPESM